MSTHIDLESSVESQDAEPVRAAKAFLHGDADEVAGPLPDDVAEALIAALVRYEAAARLEKLAAGKDKPLAKRARGGLHRLRARGIQTEVPRPSIEPILARAAAPEPEPTSLVSSTIRDGERLVWFTRNDDRGKVEIFQAQVHEVRGLTQFQALRTSRKRWRAAVTSFLAELHMPVAPVEGKLARWLIEEGVQHTSEAGRLPPREYSEIQHLLGAVQAPGRHPAYELVPQAKIEAARVQGRFERLFEMPETEGWIAEEEQARKAALQLSELAVSRVVADEVQRREQAQEIITRATGEALATRWRARLGRRLLDTAHLIAARAGVAKPGRDFAGDAALAAAAGEQVLDPAVSGEELVIARRLFERLLAAAGFAQAQAAVPARDGIMVPPLGALGGDEDDE